MDCTKCMDGFPQHGSENQSLEAIRALHQTVVSLRTALDKSKSELQELKSKSLTDVETDIFKLTIEKLSLENHVLRQRILVTQNLVKDVKNIEVSKVRVDEKKYSNYMDQPPSKTFIQTLSNADKEKFRSDNGESCELPEKGDSSNPDNKESKNKGISENVCQGSREDRPNIQKVNRQSDETAQTEKKETADKDPAGIPIDTEDYFEEDRGEDSESEELDDIELIFTTEDTKDLPTAQENLVSITDAESWNPVEGTPILLRYTEAQQFDEAPEGSELKTGKIQMGKDSESDLEKTWENSVLLETDISRCGIVEESSSRTPQISQQNTFPSPSHHRPIIHGEKAFPGGIRGLSRPSHGYERRPSTIGVTATELEAGATRPILIDGGRASARRESGAQTDITALPSRWRSEGYLTHKVSHNFTTLPSKFTMPPSPLPSPTPHRDENKKHSHSHHSRDQRLSTERRAHLHTNEESREARRTLLSDINFTSMVPELSRSADHLCQDGEGIKGRHMESGQCLLMDQRLGKKYDTGKDESLLLCGLKRGFDGYRLGCQESCRRGRGSSSARPTTWDCSMCRTSNSFRQTPTSWSSIPSTPNAQETEWNADILRKNQWKNAAAKSPTWAYSVPTSPTHGHQTGLQSHPLSYNFPHQCACRPSGSHLYYSGGGSGVSSWDYDGAASSSKPKTSVPYSASSTSFSAALGLNSRKGADMHQRQKNRVTFKDPGMWRSSTRPGNSLPDLRDEYRGIQGLEEEEELYGWGTSKGRGGNSGSGGDSTDSLIDEAEEFLRRSIDSILTGVDWTRVGRRRQTRRHSDPDPVRELRPPQSAQPFLPKEPKDLRPECFIKVILSNGRVVVGRVRYSGILRGSDKEEFIVGVELPCQSGDSDGTFKGIRYFDCNPNRAVFVPFKKVIIAWNT